MDVVGAVPRAAETAEDYGAEAAAMSPVNTSADRYFWEKKWKRRYNSRRARVLRRKWWLRLGCSGAHELREEMLLEAEAPTR